MKGGGVIDFFAKLYEVPAKEASHLLTCAYGISPYNSEQIISENSAPEKTPAVEKTEPSQQNREVFSREEFEVLENKVKWLAMIV